MSRHLQQKFCYISSRQCLDNIFLPILKNSGQKLIFFLNNCFRASHMSCEARFLSLMVFLSFPQLNVIFRASILNCTAALFARFRYFQNDCNLQFQTFLKIQGGIFKIQGGFSKSIFLMNFLIQDQKSNISSKILILKMSPPMDFEIHPWFLKIPPGFQNTPLDFQEV